MVVVGDGVGTVVVGSGAGDAAGAACAPVAGVTVEGDAGEVDGADVEGLAARSSRWSWCLTALRCATRLEGADIVVGALCAEDDAAVTLTAPAVSPAAHTAPSAQVASGFIVDHLSSLHRALRPVARREINPARWP